MKWGVLLGLLFYLGMLSAQAPATWGAKLGMNLSQHYGNKSDAEDYNVKSGVRAGISGGAFLDFAANDNLSLGFEALYSMKGSRQKIRISTMELDGVYEELAKPATMDVRYYIDYLEIPVLFKIKTLSVGKLDLWAVTGTAMSLKLKGHHDLDGTVWFPNDDGSFTTFDIRESSNLKDINIFDFSFVYGGFIDLGRSFPLSIEYRFTLGWDYLHLPTYNLFEPVALRNQAYSVYISKTF